MTLAGCAYLTDTATSPCLNDRDPNVRIVSCTRLIQTGRIDATEQMQALQSRGAAFHRLGQFEQAIADYDDVLRLNPNDAVAYQNRARAYISTDRIGPALDDLDNAVRLEPGNASAHHDRGWAHLKGESFELAIVDFTKAIDLAPNDAQSHYRRGNVYRDIGRRDLAIRDYRKVIVLKPDASYAKFELAWILATAPEDGLRDGAEAVRLAKDVVAIGNDSASHDVLAAALAEAGDFAAAIEAEQKAIDMRDEAAPDGKVAKLHERLDLYRQGKPFREKPRPAQPKPPAQDITI